MDSRRLIAAIRDGELDSDFRNLYGGQEALAHQRARYIACLEKHISLFGEKQAIWLFSSPGRIELGGSHTGSQNGHTLAAAVDADIIGVVGENAHSMLRIESEGSRPESIDLWDLRMKDREHGQPSALIRGIAAWVRKRGAIMSGVDLCMDSSIPRGGGLGACAAFELLIAAVLNSLFCGGELSPVELAMIARMAEDSYYGRPGHLTAQTACAVGDCVLLDLKHPRAPAGERMDFDLSKRGSVLISVNCGVSHTYLDDELAAIPLDMHSVARFFGAEVLREVSPVQFYENLAPLRKRVGDKAVLRAAHFFDETQRVVRMAEAVKSGNMPAYFRLVDASGVSSCQLLQNVYSEHNSREQGLSVGLCLARQMLPEGEGACRIQGNGFSGSILAYVRQNRQRDFIARMETVFGPGCCRVLNIRKAGAAEVAAPSFT